MVRNHTFRFRVTKTQFERIKSQAEAKGHVNIASYLRDLALQRNDLIESKIIETNELVKQIHEASQ